MFFSLGNLVYRFRWLVIGIWLVLFGASIFFTLNYSVPLAGASLTTPNMESEQAVNAMREKLALNTASIDIVFDDTSLTVDDASYRQGVLDTVARVEALPEVKQVSSYYSTGSVRMVSEDRHTTYASVGLKETPADSEALVSKLRETIGDGAPKARLSGDIVIGVDLEATAMSDLVQAEAVALPISLLVLLFIFGSFVAASLPVSMGGVAIVATMAMLNLLARVTEVSVFAMNVTSMLGLGLGIDYSLLLVSRFREELKAGRDVRMAVSITVATAGKTIFFSGFIVFIGLSGLLFFENMVFKSLAYGGMGVVVLSILAAITLVPAVLGVLGSRLNALSIRRGNGKGTFWSRVARLSTKHPVPVFLVSLAMIVLLAIPVMRITFGLTGATALPKSAESRVSSDLMVEKFGVGETSPILVVLRSDENVLSSNNVAAAYALTKELEADPRVERVEGLFNLDPQITLQQYQMMYANPAQIPSPQLAEAVKRMSSPNLTFLTVISKSDPMMAESKQLVRDIRDVNPGGDLWLQVGGFTAASLDIDDSVFADFPMVIAVVIAATIIALFVMLRSVVLPIKAALMSVMAILASLGVLVLIFQDGNLADLLSFTPQGFIDTLTPIILFGILFGLSMDYEVFLLARIKETWDKTGDNTLAISEGLEKTGRIITSAAAVMVVVTGSFAATNLLHIKSIGMGAAIAILLDATIVRIFLVPSAMRLLGRANWWGPGYRRRSVSARETARPRQPRQSEAFWSKWSRVED